MSRVRLGLVLAGLSSVIACKHEVTLEHRQLPGFSIDVPRAKELAPQTSLAYATGSLAIRDDAHAAVAIVAWSVGPKLSRVELDQMLGGFARSLTPRARARFCTSPGRRAPRSRRR